MIGLPPSSGTGSGTQTPISQTDSNINSLLNTPTPRSQTPNLETLAGLLQQQTPQMSGMGNLGAIGSVGGMDFMGLTEGNQEHNTIK